MLYTYYELAKRRKGEENLKNEIIFLQICSWLLGFIFNSVYNKQRGKKNNLQM